MTDHWPALEHRPDRPDASWGAGSCSLEAMSERIGAVITWLALALQRVLAGEAIALEVEVAEALVRGWIAGLEPGARAHFLALALSDRCHTEGPRLVRAILEVLVWPRARSRAALDPPRRSCEGGPHAPGHSVDGLAAAGRLQRCAGDGDQRGD